MFGMFGRVLGARRVVGMGGVFFRMLLVGTFVVSMLVMSPGDGVGLRLRGGRCRDDGRNRLGFGYGSLARVSMVMLAIIVRVVVIVRMIVRVMVVVVVFRFGVMMFVTRRVGVLGLLLLPVIGLRRLRRIDARAFDDLALNAIAMAAAAGVAVARTAAVAVGTVFAFFLGLAMGALIRLDQRLTVSNRNLIIVRMNFAEGEEAVAIAAILDERRLQRRFYARDLGEVDVAAQLLALGGLEIKLFDAIAANHNDPGLFRVSGIDQHFVGHFGTHDGGGRVWRCAHLARPGDATVHLIRG